jgi:Lsr2
MARNVSVIITDDLDGSEGAETVAFGLDGVNFDIDLSAANRSKFEQAMAPFIAAARRSTRRSPRRSDTRQGTSRVDRSVVRAWAKEAGLKVSERGRISAEIMQQYEAAHQ